MPVAAEQVKQIMPNAKGRIDKYFPFLISAMEEFQINTPLRQAAFLAQLAHESGELRYMEEIASGEAYEGRRDLGNTQKGDGKLFKGRGPIQLTGRANYQKFGDILGIDLISDPKIAATPEVGFRIAGQFWKMKDLNRLADGEDFSAITKRINGGYNGLNERIKYYERAKKVLATPTADTTSHFSVSHVPAIIAPASPTVTPETGKPAEVSETIAAPAGSEESSSQKVQKVAQSLGSKLMAGGLTGGGGLSAIFLAVVGALKNPYVIAGIVLIILVGAWLWNESKKRQAGTQNKLIDAAASKEKNTVVIVPPPAATG